jgi:hypothetical protein
MKEKLFLFPVSDSVPTTAAAAVTSDARLTVCDGQPDPGENGER